MAVAGGLAVGAMGVGTGVASADAGLGHVGQVPASWATDHGDHGGWHGDHGRGGWNNGPGWNNGGGWYNGYNSGPIPGGWNGGWEPNGGICLGPFCV